MLMHRLIHRLIHRRPVDVSQRRLTRCYQHHSSSKHGSESSARLKGQTTWLLQAVALP